MEVLTGVDLPDPSPSNRVTVYVVSSTRAVQKLYGDNARYVGGFYIPRAGGSVAFVPQVDSGGSGQLDYSMIALLHEYAHHFLISNSRAGGAALVRRGRGGVLRLGRVSRRPAGSRSALPANHRARRAGFYARDVTVEQLLDPAAYERRRAPRFDSFYGGSRALYHYLQRRSRGAPRTNFGRYLTLMGEEKGSREARVEAFGDFEQLDREIDKYLRQRKILAVLFAARQAADRRDRRCGR